MTPSSSFSTTRDLAPPTLGVPAPTNAPATQAQPDRLGYTPWPRIYLAATSAFVLGSLLGVSKGGSSSALRFRAENSHRLPASQRGWYLYHRAKNHYVLRESLREGVTMGVRLAPWVGLFFLVEHAVDEVRDDVEEWDWKEGREVQPGRHKDFLATTVAGLTVAGAFGAYKRMTPAPAARMLKIGLVTGLGFGLAQDALKLAQGGRLAYVDLAKKTFGFGG